MDVGGIPKELLIALFTATVLTPLVRWGALKIGWQHRPDPRKWQRKENPHPTPIALMGGWAMLGGVWGGVALSSAYPKLFVPLILATGASFLGFYDDLRSPSPYARLCFQTLLALITVATVGWVQGLPPFVAIPITIFGIVGLMNSANMMDNMDGVASGMVMLAMLGFAMLGFLSRNLLVVSLSLAIAGAALGFWLYNKPPASIFMGDTGSLMLGYFLAVTGVMASWGEFENGFSRLFAPLLVVSLFITDTAFVVVWRKWHGLPVMVGDRNHISHRLAILFGHSEWHANLVLYSLQLILNALAVLIAVTPASVGMGLFALAVVGLLALSYWLWKVPVDVKGNPLAKGT